MQKVLTRLLGGIDTSGGVMIFVITCLAFHQEFSWKYFLLTILAAHSPDGDFIPYLLIKKHLPYRSHHLIGHHPLLLIPVAGFLGWWIGGAYGATLSTSAITLHFFHDSMQSQGLHWFSPFSWRRISFKNLRPRLVPEAERMKFLESLSTRLNSGGEVLGRLPALTKGEWIFCGVAWIVFVLFVSLT